MYVCFSLGEILYCVVSNLNLLHISQWITLPTQMCLVLYTFWANLPHLHYSTRVIHTRVSWRAFTGSLIEGKSLQVCSTLLSILADLNNSVIRKVSFLPIISNSSCPLSNIKPQLVSWSLTCSKPTVVLRQGPSIYQSFRFLSFSPCGLPEW